MAFADLLKSDFDGIVAGPFSELVEVKRDDHLPWETVSAQVVDDADALGSSGELGPAPIRVFVSKGDIASVKEQKTKVKTNGKTYRVHKVTADVGGFELYCLP